MTLLKRLDRLDIATADLRDAVEVYRRNFDLELRRPPSADDAVLAIGDAEIRLVAGPAAAAALSASGEGMAALYLEADDVEPVAQALERAGYPAAAIRKEGGRRVLAVDPHVCGQVPLFIFDCNG